jgi:hypothetical protein
MSRFEKLTLGLSAAALAVSLLTAGVSVWIYQRSTRSILRFDADADFSQKAIRFEKLNDASNSVSFRKHAYLFLTNLGNAPLSVESVDIWVIDPQITNPEGAVWSEVESRTGPWHSDPQFGPLNLVFLSDDGKPVKFPLAIDQRREVKLDVYLSISIPKKLWEKVNNKIPVGIDLDYSNVEDIFDHAGIPHWGYDKPYSGNGPSKVTPYFRYFLVRIVKEDGTLLSGEFDLLGSRGGFGENY